MPIGLSGCRDRRGAITTRACSALQYTARAGLLALIGLGAVGCTATQAVPQPAAAEPPPPSSPNRPDTQADPLELVLARPLTLASPPQTPVRRATLLEVSVSILRVEVPRDQRPALAALWNHVREDALDLSNRERLQANGLRVGVGLEAEWSAVSNVLDAVDGVRTVVRDPVRLPPRFPLALELDTAAHDQTLFFMASDGVLTGESWPASRNVLRISYDFDQEQPQRLLFLVVPEVRQVRTGWQWTPTPKGLAKQPSYAGRAVAAAAMEVSLAPGEFLVLAPGSEGDVPGMVGRTFLVQEDGEGRVSDSLVFLRADVTHVAQRY